jgi:PKD repeat protein
VEGSEATRERRNRCVTRPTLRYREAVQLLLLLVACASKDSSPAGHDSVDTPGGGDDSACDPGANIAVNRTSGGIPLTVELTASAMCDGAWRARWDFGDGTQGEGLAVSHTWLASGEYVVRLDLEGDVPLSATTTITVSPAECPEIDGTNQVGTLGDPELVEASGLAAGLHNPGVLWSHNDSGDAPRLFALDEDGTARGTFLLDGAPEGDWEDLAIGPDADGVPTLYVGDIGSGGGRDTFTIFVLPEPEVPAEPAAVSVADWWSFTVEFPDPAPEDANALLLDPVSGDLLIAADEGGSVGLYRAPAPFGSGDVVLLERMTGFTFGGDAFPGSDVVSGGAVSPLGDKLVLRTLDTGWLWRRDQAGTLADAWAGDPCEIPIATETRGEAITFSADGGGYYTTSEEAAQPIWYTGFVPPCTGPEIAVTPDDLEIPAEPTFSVDTACLPAGIDTVAWSFGDGATSEAVAPSHLYLASGLHTVTADLVDNEGTSWSLTKDVEVRFPDCPTVGVTQTWGTVENEEIEEASGLGQSTLNAGVLWTHNDSSDSARLFALSSSGAHIGEFSLDTDSRDWEDLSLGWDETLGGPAIYVGDFGDNGAVREDITVLVIPEPTIAAGDIPVTATLTGFSTLTLVYPDGAHNAESLLLDPVTGDLYIVTKSYTAESYVYRKPAPHEDGTTTTLEYIATLTFGVDPLPGNRATTAGDFSPLGDRIAIRTYDHAWMWRRDQAASVADAFATPPCDLNAPTERQGEAITFTTDGTGYLTLSEGDAQPIYYTPLE